MFELQGMIRSTELKKGLENQSEIIYENALFNPLEHNEKLIQKRNVILAPLFNENQEIQAILEVIN